MSIVTRTGDKGQTGVIGGSRVSKDVPRLEAYGTVDELNSLFGVVLSQDGIPEPLRAELTQISHWLFDLGCDLATPGLSPSSDGAQPMLGENRSKALESWIEREEKTLPPLKQFILPGGHPAAAHLHHARTVCRRAERRTVVLYRETGEARAGLIFLNRLSDLLFTYARRVNIDNGLDDIHWSKSSS